MPLVIIFKAKHYICYQVLFLTEEIIQALYSVRIYFWAGNITGKCGVRGVTKVCILCEIWESGGIEAFFTNVITHMDLGGMELHLVAARLGESVFTPVLVKYGVQFHQLSGSTRKIGENHRLFRKILREHSFDVVHLNAYQGLSLAHLSLARSAGVPRRIAHSHGAGLRNSLGKRLKLCLHRLGRGLWSSSATDFFASSHNAACFLFPKDQPYHWIPNGIETDRFRFRLDQREKIRHALGLAESTFLVGTVGRLSEEKNHRFLLEVFCAIRKRRPDSVLLLVGTGPLEDRLRSQARTLGLGESVRFYGPSPDVAPLLWAMDLFVFPSHSEGLGIAGVEAQAAGLPVLCSEGIPPEAVVTEQVTRLPLSVGPEAWAEAALKARAEERCHAADTVEAAGFSIQAVADKIQRVWVGGKLE